MAEKFSVLLVRNADYKCKLCRGSYSDLQEAYAVARRKRPEGWCTYVDRTDLLRDPEYRKNAADFVARSSMGTPHSY